MLKSKKDIDILKFEKELYVAHKRGYIFRYTHTSEFSYLGDYSKIVGVEILFSDEVSTEQIEKIKHYIEKQYLFKVDMSTYMEVNNAVKIIVVRY
jgi:hypothetical protein